MIAAVWLVSAGSSTGKYTVAATVSGRPMESEFKRRSHRGPRHGDCCSSGCCGGSSHCSAFACCHRCRIR